MVLCWLDNVITYNYIIQYSGLENALIIFWYLQMHLIYSYCYSFLLTVNVSWDSNTELLSQLWIMNESVMLSPVESYWFCLQWLNIGSRGRWDHIPSPAMFREAREQGMSNSNSLWTKIKIKDKVTGRTQYLCILKMGNNCACLLVILKDKLHKHSFLPYIIDQMCLPCAFFVVYESEMLLVWAHYVGILCRPTVIHIWNDLARTL